MVKPITLEDCLAITKIHIGSLKEDFLPSLGLHFLKTFYEGIIGKSGVYGFLSTENKKINGFVVGTKDSSRFFSQVLRDNFLKLSFLIFLQVIKKPTIIRNIFETFLYPNKDVGPKAELVVIAVSKNYQGKGAGKMLVEALENAFRKDKVRRYKLTVHADKKAVGFYEHLGYSRTSGFRLYGKMWFVYEKNTNRLSHASS